MARLSSSILAILALAAAPAAATTPAYPDQGRPYAIARTATFEVQNSVGEAYDIMVAWPEGNQPAGGWPVLYVLDGEDNFPIVAATARRLARAGARSGVTEGVVVGIGAGPLARRVRDYTPPVPGYVIPAGQPASGFATGGSEAFLDMLERQVMPVVRERWSIDEQREAIVGHSFGGLLAIHALLARPGMFDAAIAISPSLWFGNGVIDREVAGNPAENAPRRLLMAEGENQSTSLQNLTQRLRAEIPAVEATLLQLAGQSHGTTFLAAIAPATHFAFGRAEQ